jgi:hypothetical protein
MDGSINVWIDGVVFKKGEDAVVVIVTSDPPFFLRCNTEPTGRRRRFRTILFSCRCVYGSCRVAFLAHRNALRCGVQERHSEFQKRI